MELYDVLRTTFAAREFTDDPLPDEVLFTILDRARFAPSGGNRQGWRVIVVRDSKTRQVLAELTAPAAKRYAAAFNVRWKRKLRPRRVMLLPGVPGRATPAPPGGSSANC